MGLTNLRKPIIQILILISIIQILLILLFVFVIKKDGTKKPSEEVTKYQNTKIEIEITTPEFKYGQELFINDCNVCHRKRSIINTRQMRIGIISEMGINYLKKYITKQDSLLNVKDEYVMLLKDNYGNSGSIHEFKYSEPELNYLIEYIKAEK